MTKRRLKIQLALLEESIAVCRKTVEAKKAQIKLFEDAQAGKCVPGQHCAGCKHSLLGEPWLRFYEKDASMDYIGCDLMVACSGFERKKKE